MKRNRKREREQQKKIKEYSEFLKEDYDFDWAYFVYLMIFKLERMARCLANGYNENRMKRVAEIKEVVRLLKRVVGDNYHERAMRAFYKKHGRPKMIISKNSGAVDFIYKNGQSASEKMRRELIELWRLEDELLQNDLDLAMKKLARRLRWWWD